MLDKFTYPKYTQDTSCFGEHPTKEDMPYLLEHVFDLNSKRYVSNSDNCCYYSPVDNIIDLSVESDDSNIVSVEDDMIVANRVGKIVLFVNHNGKVSKIKVIVHYPNAKVKLLKDTLVLEVNNMIPVLTVLKHIHCKHYNDCIFDRYDFLVDEEYNHLKQSINELYNVINAYRNGEIIYHELLDDYYNINIDKVIDSTGVHYKTNVNVSNNFVNRVKHKISEMEQTLREIMRNKR